MGFFEDTFVILVTQVSVLHSIFIPKNRLDPNLKFQAKVMFIFCIIYIFYV